LRIKLFQLKQKNKELITKFLKRAKDLVTKLPINEINVGIIILKDIKNKNKRNRVTYNCNKE